MWKLQKIYREGLGQQEKWGYNEILQLKGGKDPSELAPSSWKDDPAGLPPISYPDKMNYLIFSPSSNTTKDLKCYQGLDVYKQVVYG